MSTRDPHRFTAWSARLFLYLYFGIGFFVTTMAALGLVVQVFTLNGKGAIGTVIELALALFWTRVCYRSIDLPSTSRKLYAVSAGTTLLIAILAFPLSAFAGDWAILVPFGIGGVALYHAVLVLSPPETRSEDSTEPS